MAKKGINKAIIMGVLGKDPEKRVMQNGKSVVAFSLATSESWKDKSTGEKMEQTEWHRCVAYDGLADVIAQYMSKGSKMYIEGKLQTKKYTDKSGVEKYSTQILVNDMQMLGDSGAKQAQGGSNQPAPAPTYNNQPNPREQTGSEPFMPDADFDDPIPF